MEHVLEKETHKSKANLDILVPLICWHPPLLFKQKALYSNFALGPCED